MFEADSLDWKNYEIITKYIYETLGKESGVKVEGYGNSCKVKGKSGVSHQIDVLTMHTDGIHNYRTAIECKYWNDKINKDIIMKVSEIIEDAGINKGVIVSKKGYTEDAVSFARYKNIGLVELREIEERDWEGRPRVFGIKSWVMRPEILGVIVEPVDSREIDKETIDIDKIFIKQIDGGESPFIDLMTSFKKDLHKENPFNTITKCYELPGAILVNHKTNTSTKIKRIIFTGVLTKLDIDLKFSPVDQIWLIMKSIFDERTFTISKNGLIVEDKRP